jgi:hypothetical protein
MSFARAVLRRSPPARPPQVLPAEQQPLRRTTAVAGVVLALVVLGGCADEGEQYCEALAEEQENLNELADSSAEGGGTLTPTLEAFERLRTAAPEELRDEWDTLVVAYEALADAVEQAGIDPAEFRPDDLPEGLSEAEADRLASVASKLVSARVVEAVAGIQQHATEVCDVNFGA